MLKKNRCQWTYSRIFCCCQQRHESMRPFFWRVQKPNIKKCHLGTWLDNKMMAFFTLDHVLYFRSCHWINNTTQKEIEFLFCSFWNMTLKMCPWLLGWNNAIIHKPHLDWHKKSRTQIEFQYGQQHSEPNHAYFVTSNFTHTSKVQIPFRFFFMPWKYSDLSYCVTNITIVSKLFKAFFVEDAKKKQENH